MLTIQIAESYQGQQIKTSFIVKKVLQIVVKEDRVLLDTINTKGEVQTDVLIPNTIIKITQNEQQN